MISPEAKRRYVALRKRGTSQAKAMALAGIESRASAWRIDRKEGIVGRGVEDQEPEPAASPTPAPPPNAGTFRDRVVHDSEVRAELEGVLPLEVIAALEAPDQPAQAEIAGGEGLPPVVIDAGDSQEPSGGFGAKAIPPGHPALSRKSYVPGRDRSFAVGMNPSEADLGPDPDIAGHTQRQDAPGGAPWPPTKPIDESPTPASFVEGGRGEPRAVGGRPSTS
jgi:hypothetical protein